MIKTSVLYKRKRMSFTEQDLYWEYKNELWSILKTNGTDINEVSSWYLDIINSDAYIIRVFDTEKPSGEQIGFVFIACNNNCPESYDYYIQDCYISPKYRQKHIMWDVMQKFIGNHPGRYCLFLIEDNIPAKCFWGKMFNYWGYSENTNIYLKTADKQILKMIDEKTKFHGYI